MLLTLPEIPVSLRSRSRTTTVRAIAEFNELLYQSPDWFTTIIPLRDGVTVATRL